MTINFPQLNKIKKLLKIKKKISNKGNFLTFVPFLLTMASMFVTLISGIASIFGIIILFIYSVSNVQLPDHSYTKDLIMIFKCIGVFIASIGITCVFSKFHDKIENKVYSFLREDKVDQKIIELLNDKKQIITYCEAFVAEQPDAKVYGKIIQFKKDFLQEKVNIKNLIMSLEALYESTGLKNINIATEENTLEHEIGATNNVKKYL